MSTADLVAVAACLALQFISSEVYHRRRLSRERRAHEATRAQFRREVIREWASKMPKTGKIAPDPFCPRDTVYVLNVDLCRLPPGDAA